MSNSPTNSTPQPELRAGVTWRNPENLTPDRIPAGYRLLTSVEQTIPDDALTTRGPGALQPTKHPGKSLAKGLGDYNTYVTRQPLPSEALPVSAEFPKLRTGVAYRNPEGALPEHLPPGYRLLTSVESEVPRDAETSRVYSKPEGDWLVVRDTSYLRQDLNSGWTYRTRTPFPAAVLPAVEPQLPDGVSWLGRPLDQESLDAGWRRLCTADKTGPGDMEFMWCEKWQSAGCSEAGLGVLHGLKAPFTFSYRTKAPLPEFKKPLEFPPLPAGVTWRNPNNMSPEYFGVAEGWRPLCSLDETFPGDYEWSGTPGNLSGEWKTSCRYVGASLSGFWGSKENYRTKVPIPQPKPVTVSAGTIDGHPITTSRQKLPRYAEGAFAGIAEALGADTNVDPTTLPALVRRMRAELITARDIVRKQAATLGDLGAVLCDARSTDPATLVETAKNRRAELMSVHNQLDEVKTRLEVRDFQYEMLQESCNTLRYGLMDSGHALRQVNDILDGNLDPSSGVRLDAAALKVAALVKMKIAAELEVADLKKANESQTAVIDEVAKLVGDESGTLSSLTPAVAVKVNRLFEREQQILRARGQMYAAATNALWATRGDMALGLSNAADILNDATK